MKATIIIGLPGSGKTYLGNSLKDNDTIFFDDYDQFHHEDGMNVIIAHPLLCRQDQLNKLVNFLGRFDYDIEYIYFENNPEQCKKNIIDRALSRPFGLIDNMSKQYIIPDNSKVRPVWHMNDS